MVYCTSITARLIQLKLKVRKKQIKVIDIGETCTVSGCSVTAYDANHCPGAAMFLFHVHATNKKYLHVGDFRYDRTKVRLSSRMFPLEKVYVDTTYCDPKYTFPKMDEAIQNACRLGKKYASSANSLVYFGSYRYDFPACVFANLI